MIHMQDVGYKISKLRKGKNMTQMELADQMGISFQAVSNWERGNSMPDISKLPELAQFFGVTIDELLGQKSELLDAVAINETTAYLENNPVTPEQLSQIAPILKPEQVDTILERTQISHFHELSELLPFISCDVINQLAQKAAEDGMYDDLASVAPFADGNVLDEIACKLVHEGKDIQPIAPFVSDSTMAKLAEMTYQEHGLSSLNTIMPFIPPEQLQAIAEEEYNRNGFANFESVAPFLQEDYLDRLAQRVIRENGLAAIGPIAPFLNRNRLSRHVKEQFL